MKQISPWILFSKALHPGTAEKEGRVERTLGHNQDNKYQVSSLPTQCISLTEEWVGGIRSRYIEIGKGKKDRERVNTEKHVRLLHFKTI